MRVQLQHDHRNGYRAVALDIIPENQDEERLLELFNGLQSSMMYLNFDKYRCLQLNVSNRSVVLDTTMMGTASTTDAGSPSMDPRSSTEAGSETRVRAHETMMDIYHGRNIYDKV